MMSTPSDAFGNVVIRASAGTGKTYQLSNRFLGLLAAGEPLDDILATTFTRKAAGEILDRLLLRLAEAADDVGKLSLLADGVGDRRLDRARCLTMLRTLVRQLHRLRVGTLDSFFLQIARTFSLELALPPGWQIADEIVDDRLRMEAIRAVLDDQSTGDAVKLMHLLTKGEAVRSVSAQIGSLVAGLYGIYLEAPASAWESVPRYKALEPGELSTAIEGLSRVEIPADKRFAKAREQELADAREGNWEGFIRRGLASRVLQGTLEYYGKPITPAMQAAYEPLLRQARAALLGPIANQTDATRRLLERFDRAYERLKLAARGLRFDDVTRKLGELAMTERMDEVVYRLDAHVSHLLLDEFQDTSLVQWRVLRPLARRVTEPGSRRSFFCVGDVKQAIYGWRGGVAEIFEALDAELMGLAPQSLNRSWRCCPAVIDTVNRVFEDLASNRVLARHADAAAAWSNRFQRHTTARTELPGYCRMIAAPRAGEGQKQTTVTLVFAAQEIARLHAEAPGFSLGVLVRRNQAVARLIYELRQRGVEASEEGGNPLTDSPAVQLVLSLLTLADHPGQSAAAFHVAHSPLASHLGLPAHDDAAAVGRLAADVRRAILTDGYGPTIYSWVSVLAQSCGPRDLRRLEQLVELAYRYEAAATLRADDFVSLVARQRVQDPTGAPVRVMTVHQAKGLQFDIVVLPELDVRLVGQTPLLVVGRARPTEPIDRVCRYVSQEGNLRLLLPKPFQAMFDADRCRGVEEALCVLYVAMTRAVHAMHLVVAPSAENERSIPTTAAGVVRAALAGKSPLDPGQVVYEHGAADWATLAAAGRRPAAAPAPVEEEAPPLLRLAPPPEKPKRGLDRRSPSQLEGGARVDLGQRLKLESGLARARGTLIHAWFEQIEWLDDGEPGDELLRQIAVTIGATRLDVGQEIAQFRRMLAHAEIRAVLTRATYRQPAARPGGPMIHAGPGIADPQWRVWRERPFALRGGETIFGGVMDRLVALDDGDRPVGADVLDFKTDAVLADDPGALAAKVEYYRPQIDIYRRAAAELLRLAPDRVSARLAFVACGVIRAL